MDKLKIIISSYFAFFGVEIADMLDSFSEVDQRRITQVFMNIIEGELYKTDDEGETTITIPVAKDIEDVVLVFVKFYNLDKEVAGTLEMANDFFKKKNNQF